MREEQFLMHFFDLFIHDLYDIALRHVISIIVLSGACIVSNALSDPHIRIYMFNRAIV